MFAVPTIADLAQFTGRAEATFTAFADQALTQATLLFSLVTQCSDYSDDPNLRALARNAIMEMADRMYLEQPHAVDRSSPFTSETIGSYSYSTSGAAAALASKDGRPTGLFWWDLAIDELSCAVGRSKVMSGSVTGMERADLYIDGNGQRHILGPGDFDTVSGTHYVNAELNPRPSLG
jgi:hypothetical protein